MTISFCVLLLSLCMVHFSRSMNIDSSHLSDSHYRKLLADQKQNNSSRHSHNDTKEAKIIPELKDEESMAGTEAAVLIIVVIVVLSVIGMVVYFVRKFDQLNRSLPTYRYSSLKTEINGLYGDDKIESQVLVSVSTEEEDDFDDDEDVSIFFYSQHTSEKSNRASNLSPPTLLVKSQTVMANKASNGSLPIHHGSSHSSEIPSKSEETLMDSDDELLQ